MLEISSDKLRIVPLNLEQFRLLLSGMKEMETALGLNFSNENFDEHTQQAMEGLYQEALKNSRDYWWYTNWQIILKSQNISIGSLCFMRRPNETGEVEAGYGINEHFRNQGYMTEALQAVFQWAFQQPKVASIIAETEKDNPASHRVLQKCGMYQDRETERSLWWKLDAAR
jgi:[ribosomal protein S5]-alanine N-acetyltransferase